MHRKLGPLTRLSPSKRQKGGFKWTAVGYVPAPDTIGRATKLQPGKRRSFGRPQPVTRPCQHSSAATTLWKISSTKTVYTELFSVQIPSILYFGEVPYLGS